MTSSYFRRFVATIEKEGGVFAGRDEEGRLLLAEYRDRQFDPPVVLEFTADEFEAAMEQLGEGADILWPDVSQAERGYRLALVHVAESVDTLDHQPRRMHFTTAGLWVD
jgi:hypothetical protein